MRNSRVEKMVPDAGKVDCTKCYLHGSRQNSTLYNNGDRKHTALT